MPHAFVPNGEPLTQLGLNLKVLLLMYHGVAVKIGLIRGLRDHTLQKRATRWTAGKLLLV